MATAALAVLAVVAAASTSFFLGRVEGEVAALDRAIAACDTFVATETALRAVALP